MALRFEIQPQNPQTRKIDAVVDELRAGAIILFPTDTVYAIGCDLTNRDCQQRIRSLRHVPEDKPLTFIVSSLSRIADYAIVSDPAYKLLRRLIPGPYTFLLPATRLVPKLVMNAKRRTAGIRVPKNVICQSIITELGNPIISMSAKLPDVDEPADNDELFEMFENLVDIIIEEDVDEFHRSRISGVSTMIDLTGPEPEIVREGLGVELAWQYV